MRARLVDRLLDAVLDPSIMDEVLDDVAREFSAHYVSVQLNAPEQSKIFRSQSASGNSHSPANANGRAPIEPLGIVLPLDVPHLPEQIQQATDQAASALSRDAFQSETDAGVFLRKVAEKRLTPDGQATVSQIRHQVGATISLDVDSHLTLLFEREGASAPFDSEEERAIAYFIHEVERSLKYAKRGQLRLLLSLVESFDTADTANAWVSAAGHIRHASPAFKAVIQNFIEERDGVLTPVAGDDAALMQLIRDALSSNEQLAPLVLQSDGDSTQLISVTARPLRLMDGFGQYQSDVLLSVKLPRKDTGHIESELSKRYSLTPAEIRLVLRIKDGESLRNASEHEKISYESARTRLKVVFQKMSVSRQSELILKLYTL